MIIRTIFFFFLFIWPNCIYAKIDCNGPCPQEPKIGDFGDYFYAVILKEDVAVLNSPMKNAKKLKISSNFGKLVYIYDRQFYRTIKDKQLYYLVGPANQKGSLWGWINNKDLLTDRNAIQGKNFIYLKVLLANNFQAGNFVQRVSFHAGPGKKYKIINNSDLFSIWYVFREENGYFFIGSQQNWNPESWVGQHSMIAGWVKKTNCYLWNTRFALDYYKENFNQRERVLFFDEVQSIDNYYSNESQSGIVMTEPDNDKSTPFALQRFPVLGFDQRNNKLFLYIGVPGEKVLIEKNQKKIKLIKETVHTDTDFLDCIRNGGDTSSCSKNFKASEEITQNKNDYRVNFTQQRLELIKKKVRETGLYESKITKFSKGFQACDQAWVYKEDIFGRQQMQFVLLADKTSLAPLIGILNYITSGLSVNPNQSLPALFAQSIKISTGDEIGDQKFGDYFKKAFGLPVRSPLLKKNQRELRTICTNSPDKCIKLIKEIKKSKIYIDSVYSEYEVEEINGTLKPVYEDDSNNIKKRKQYWWRTKSGFEYAWIPWHYFP
ncbi:hypothetical protein GMMP15_1120004 [Candidatus Magnetomoraceae bacterium gMMP-15]